MRRRLAELKDTLAGFVDQRDHLVLVLAAGDPEALLALKTLEGLDDESPADVFLVFAADFADEALYATTLAAALEAQVAGANAERALRGEPPLPAPPPDCYDASRPAPGRVRALIEYARGLLPPQDDHRLVVALVPLAIHNRAGYARVVADLLPRDGFQPWMRRLRLVVRDDRDAPFVIPALRRQKAEGVLVYQPDLSTAALTDDLARDVDDPDVPLPERMAALLQLAALDYAHRRFPDAVRKYRVLYAYYVKREDRALQALCLQGLGDVLRRVDRVRAARERYQQGLATVTGCSPLPLSVVLNLVMAAGDASLELREFVDAEGYFDLGDRVAAALLNPFAKAEAMEKRGVARLGRGAIGDAQRALHDAATFCRAVGDDERLASVLRRMATVYDAAQLERERRVCESELAALAPAGR